MKINLIILAMEEELHGVLKHIKQYEEIKDKYSTLYKFNLNDKEYIMTLGKIGKVSTSLYIGYLTSIFDVEIIFNVGTSGALNKDLNVGDVVIADSVMYYDVDVTAFNYKRGQIPSCPLKFIPDQDFINKKKINNYDFKIHHGLVISGDNFLTKNNINQLVSCDILEEALCGEMESGAVAQCCYLLKIPCVIIRSISDNIFSENNQEVFDNKLEIVSYHAGSVLLDLIN